MADQSINSNSKADVVNIEEFAQMVGFPADLIKKELFESQEDQGSITMDQLRDVMLKYLNSTMLED